MLIGKCNLLQSSLALTKLQSLTKSFDSNMKLLRYLLSLVGGSIFSIATISNINTPVTLGKDFGNLAERADNIDLGDSVFKRKPVGGTPGEVVGSGSESTGNPRDLRSWRGSIQPPDRHGLWKLEILHVQAEVDLIEIQLRHSHDKPVAILKWDTILEDFPVPAHGHGFSFGLQDHNGEQMIFVPSDHRVHAQYRKVFPEHFLLLAPGETFKKTIDLREWFKVSEGGHYVISLVQGLHAIFGDDIDLTTIERYEVSALPFYLAADSKDFSFRPFPPLKPSKGLTRRATPCAGHWGEKVARARAGAKSLARFTRRNFDAQLWQEYFNGVRDVRKRVEGVYHEIEGYTDNVKINILELCDTTNSDSWCRSGMVAYHQRGAHLKIVFCDLFFSDETQADRTCEACGPYTDDNGVQQIRYDMCDAPGCFMHELTHVKELVKYEINDGTWHRTIHSNI